MDVLPGAPHNRRMHGEYKMPGGKLVVADLAVQAGRLQGVCISGDFFLEPDTALDDINRALEDCPVSASEQDLAQRVEQVLGADVLLYGISAQAVAIAVLRALEGA